MHYERFIAFRYSKSRRKVKSLSIITWIAIIGVALGLAALIITLSVMNGFEKDIRQALIGVSSHLTISTLDFELTKTDVEALSNDLERSKYISYYSPYIFKQALLVSKLKSAGALVKGIDIKSELKGSLVESIKSYSDLGPQEILMKLDQTQLAPIKNQEGRVIRQEKLFGIIVGSKLARSLGTTIGDTINLIPPNTRVSPFGSIPRFKKFIIIGIFESGLSGYDESLALVSSENANLVFGSKGYSGISIYLKDINQVQVAKQSLAEIIEFPLYLRSWEDDNKNLFAVIKLEKYALALILTLIILVAAFNIISSLIMLVQEKKRDIAVLKALGATNNSILKIFLIQGSLIGALGTFIGLIIGLSSCYLIGEYQIIDIPAGVYLKNKIPMQVDYLEVVIVMFVAFFISVAVTIIPARNAAKSNIIQGLRYE